MRVSLLLAALAGLAAAAAAPSPEQKKRDPSKSFTLSVAEKPGYTRDYVRDWAAAHQKWGNGVPKSIASAFSLLDDGMRQFLLYISKPNL